MNFTLDVMIKKSEGSWKEKSPRPEEEIEDQKEATFSGNFARCLAKYADFCVSIGSPLLAFAPRGCLNLGAKITDPGAEFRLPIFRVNIFGHPKISDSRAEL